MTINDKRIHGDLDNDRPIPEEFERTEEFQQLVDDYNAKVAAEQAQRAKEPKKEAPKQVEGECEFSKCEILSVGKLPYLSIRTCRVQTQPCSCHPSSWKKGYLKCEVRKKNLGLLSFYVENDEREKESKELETET